MTKNTLEPNAKNARPAAAIPPPQGDVASIDELRALYEKMRVEMGRVIVGQSTVIEQLLICILARGHALLMGVPGLAKTMIVNSLAQVMSLEFSRIQFTPDLMPSDITGTDIL
ncbi:MAG: magnesium chelatase ATPase subunit, partial [Verrucomicrobiales bacterium]|nr:magnesium chelatase ATPase subunit [Verrucomicrobiales bacterium]